MIREIHYGEHTHGAATCPAHHVPWEAVCKTLRARLRWRCIEEAFSDRFRDFAPGSTNQVETPQV